MQELSGSLLGSDEKSKEQRIKAYNPYKTPPDFELAKLHAVARRVCYPQNVTLCESRSNILKCPCCGLQLQNKQIEVCCNLDKISHLGPCFPLYFTYIKFCFGVLTICMFLAGVVNLTYNLLGTNCEKIADSFICRISFLNVLDPGKEVNYLRKQTLVNCVTIFVVIIVFEVFRNYQRKYAYKYRNKYSISNFSLLLSFVPEGYTKDDIQDFINFWCERIGHPPTKVLKVYFLHQLGEYAKLFTEKRNLIQKKRKESKGMDLDSEEIQSINTKLREIERLYNTNPVAGNKSRLIVVLESSRTVKGILDHFRKKLLYKIATYIYHYTGFKPFNSKTLFKGAFIKVSKAPEASDVQWENLSFPSRLKSVRRFMTAIVISVLIAIGFTMLYFLKKILKREQAITSGTDISQYVSIFISLLGSLSVAITNTILGIFIRRSVRYEKHKTHTNFFVTVGRRITAALVLNMTVTTLLANVFHSSKAGSWISFLELSVTGLFYDVFFLFITNSYMSSIFNYFDIVWGYKLIRRYRALKSGPNSQLTQREANSLFEGHPVDMALRFANVNKTLIFTGLFIPFIPVGIFLSMIGFVIVYWVDKYLLLRRYVCANRLSYSLPKAMLTTGEWFIVAYAFGNHFTFYIPLTDGGTLRPRNKIDDTYFWLSMLTFIVACVYKLFIPTNSLHKRFIKFKTPREERTFNQVKERFAEHYDDYHPVCKRQGIQASEMMGRIIEDEDESILVARPSKIQVNIKESINEPESQSQDPILIMQDSQGSLNELKDTFKSQSMIP